MTVELILEDFRDQLSQQQLPLYVSKQMQLCNIGKQPAPHINGDRCGSLSTFNNHLDSGKTQLHCSKTHTVLSFSLQHSFLRDLVSICLFPILVCIFSYFFLTEIFLIRRAKNWTLQEISSLTQNVRCQVEDRAQFRLAKSWTYSMPLGVQPFYISLIDIWVIAISSSTPEPSHTPKNPLSLDLIRSGRLPQSKQWEILLLKGSVKALVWHLRGQTLLPVASSIGAHKH